MIRCMGFLLDVHGLFPTALFIIAIRFGSKQTPRSIYFKCISFSSLLLATWYCCFFSVFFYLLCALCFVATLFMSHIRNAHIANAPISFVSDPNIDGCFLFQQILIHFFAHMNQFCEFFFLLCFYSFCNV